MKLVIVESPAKAKTIEKYLGKGFVVRASVGHIRDLPKSNKNAVDIEAGFIPRYQVVPEKQKVIHELKDAAKKADEVILATDPDREGEAIAWHLAETIGLKKPKRIVFHEITERAIQDALAHPRTIDEDLRKAQEARRVLDRLFGYELSGLVWKKVRYGLSAGRVQSPALRILMEREREIRAFVPEKFWVVSVDLVNESTVKTPNAFSRAEDCLSEASSAGREKALGVFTATCITEPKTAAEAERIADAAKNGQWFVKNIEESEASRAPKAPFTTSTLQQAASTRFGFAPSRTMGIAQKLYEQGYITYMRTDSTNLAKEAQSAMLSAVASEYGDSYVAPRVYASKSKNAQEAHEAIRPTDPRKRTAGTTEEQKKLYGLIRVRALASQMADAKMMRTKIVANISERNGSLLSESLSESKRVPQDTKTTIASGNIPDFTANGSRVTFDGWLAADPAARGEDVELPKVVMGDHLTLVDVHNEGKETQPPPRYSEAGLVKELEKRGIGRPSTYASIIKTIQDRGYVEKQGRTLVPTYTGDVVSTFIESNFADYISDNFTAEMEDELDDIASGARAYAKTLKDFYRPFSAAIKARGKIAEKITGMGDVPEEFPCPICGGPMEYKLSKTGRFMSCKKFPSCIGGRREDGGEIAPPKEIGEICPQCGKGSLIEREGRFGLFIACSNYPKCKYVKKSAEEEAKGRTGVQCPTCKQGEMVERRGRFGVFFSCSRYPECKNAIKARPTGDICNLCGSLMMEGTKTIPERCSNKQCPNHNPHKFNKK